jgi:hypothetical protein
LRLLLRIIGRLITVTVGYLAGCFAAGVTIVLAVAGWTAGFGDVGLGTLLSHAVYAGGALAAFIVVLAFPGAVIMVLVAELFAIRNGFFYPLASGLIAAVGYIGATNYAFGNDVPQGATDELIVFVAAGLVAGAAYWLIAGRTAGIWPDRKARRGAASPAGH